MCLTSSQCDQLKPVCSRCSRLQISCTGSGKQRYKFKEVRVGATLKEMETKRSRSTPSSAWSLSKTPSNEATVILNSFVHRLEVKDLRYDICWTYGNLLKEVPKRLGTNAALDASVCALTTVLSDLSTGQKSVHALTRYGWALRALRSCLNDPLIARSSSTLCAIYLIWICQVCTRHPMGRMYFDMDTGFEHRGTGHVAWSWVGYCADIGHCTLQRLAG